MPAKREHIDGATRGVVGRVLDALVIQGEPKCWGDAPTVKALNNIFRLVIQGTVANEKRDTPCFQIGFALRRQTIDHP